MQLFVKQSFFLIIKSFSSILKQCVGCFLVTHRRHLSLSTPFVGPQVYEFHDKHSGMLCIAQPPSGVPAASLLASALSWALGSPVRLPLEPLLTCGPESLPKLQRALYGTDTGTRPSKQRSMKLASPKCIAPVCTSS